MSTTTPTMIFVNLPAKDVAASGAFFSKLGYEINPQFSTDDCVCVVISDTIIVMLLSESRFADFTDRPVADARQTTESIIGLSAPSREAVDELADNALAAGGSAHQEAKDEGYMYGRSFCDLDGHIWEVMWMDPAAVA
jgi:uncharacterized protein